MTSIVDLLAQQTALPAVRGSISPIVSALSGGGGWTGLSPFNPDVNTPRDNGDGSFSTEIEITNQAPDASVWNIPTLWFDANGKPRELSTAAAQSMARRYEEATGKMFPRFPSIEDAVAAAQARSAAGGASHSGLAK